MYTTSLIYFYNSSTIYSVSSCRNRGVLTNHSNLYGILVAYFQPCVCSINTGSKVFIILVLHILERQTVGGWQGVSQVHSNLYVWFRNQYLTRQFSICIMCDSIQYIILQGQFCYFSFFYIFLSILCLLSSFFMSSWFIFSCNLFFH